MGLSTIIRHLSNSAPNHLNYRSFSNLEKQRVTISELTRACREHKWWCMNVENGVYIAKTDIALEEFKSKHPVGSYDKLGDEGPQIESNSLRTFKGSLSSNQHNFLSTLEQYEGVELKNTGAGKTMRILRHGQNLAYVNNTVYQRRSLIGYHFLDNNADACPPELLNNLPKWARQHFDCQDDEIDIYCSSNKRCTYLHIKSIPAALRALGITEEGTENVSPIVAVSQKEANALVDRLGAGFGDAAENKLVEEAAVRAVTNNYEQDGWSVETVESEKCGFDLNCMKYDKIEHVEVKGVRGTEQSFIITSGEVRCAETDPNFVLAVVNAALSKSPILTKHSGVEFKQHFNLSAIQYRAVLKQ